MRTALLLLLLVPLALSACVDEAADEAALNWTCQDYWDNIDERPAVARALLERAWLNVDDASTLPDDDLVQLFTVAMVNRCGDLVDLGQGGAKLIDEAADVYTGSGTTFRPPGE